MRLTILKSGLIRTWYHLLAGDTEVPRRIEVPVPFFVIEHGNKLILFDCGQKKSAEPVDRNAKYIALMTSEDTVTAQLKQHGFFAADVTHVILSHAHNDHCGGLDEIGAAECFIQQKEVESDLGKKLLSRFPDKKWNIINGRTDIFNDGKIITIPTYGHTPGHQSLLLILDNGTQICCAADALYMDCALDNESEQRFTSPEAIDCLRKMHDAGVHIISGHDPVSFENNQHYFNRC